MINEIKAYFLSNETKSLEFRLEALEKLKRAVLNYRDEIVIALKNDLRKPEFEAYLTEINPVLDELDYVLSNLKTWMEVEQLPLKEALKPSEIVVLSEPYGIVLIIVPFNYPISPSLIPLIGAIAAGNCVVVRTSKRTPYSSEVLNKIINDTFKANYIRHFAGAEIEAKELLEQDFNYVFFSGSVETGRIVAQNCAQRLIPYTLELGGKSPVIVDESADLTLTAKRLVRAKFINCGQTCIAPDYFLIHEKIKDEFIEELKRAIRAFYGVLIQESKDYSRIIDTEALRRLRNLISDEAKNIIYGGLVDECGLYIEPTILDNIDFNSPIMAQEIFGPIIPVISWFDKDKLIFELAKKERPLALYIFSTDEDFIKKTLKTLSFGGGCVNDAMVQNLDPRAPFGGVGKSGVGSYRGKYSFDTFSHKKTLFINKQKEILDNLFPPYDVAKLELIKKRESKS